MAKTIDAHLTGMGEPVVTIEECAEMVWHQGGPCQLPPGAKLYTAPPIDLAAVREVITHLRDTDDVGDKYLANKLEAAIKGVV